MPYINSSSLALRRKRLGYEQKQIAVLFGYNNTVRISRYETGQRMPSLKDAIKLSVLYGLPLNLLFDKYFRKSQDELEETIKRSGLSTKRTFQKDADFEHCSYLDLMKVPHLNESNADRVRRHIKILVEERSKKILGN